MPNFELSETSPIKVAHKICSQESYLIFHFLRFFLLLRIMFHDIDKDIGGVIMASLCPVASFLFRPKNCPTGPQAVSQSQSASL